MNNISKEDTSFWKEWIENEIFLGDYYLDFLYKDYEKARKKYKRLKLFISRMSNLTIEYKDYPELDDKFENNELSLYVNMKKCYTI